MHTAVATSLDHSSVSVFMIVEFSWRVCVHNCRVFHLLWNYLKHPTYFFNSSQKPYKVGVFDVNYSSFQRWGNRGKEMLSDLPKVIQLVSGGANIWHEPILPTTELYYHSYWWTIEMSSMHEWILTLSVLVTFRSGPVQHFYRNWFYRNGHWVLWFKKTSY